MGSKTSHHFKGTLTVFSSQSFIHPFSSYLRTLTRPDSWTGHTFSNYNSHTAKWNQSSTDTVIFSKYQLTIMQQWCKKLVLAVGKNCSKTSRAISLTQVWSLRCLSITWDNPEPPSTPTKVIHSYKYSGTNLSTKKQSNKQISGWLLCFPWTCTYNWGFFGALCSLAFQTICMITENVIHIKNKRSFVMLHMFIGLPSL